MPGAVSNPSEHAIVRLDVTSEVFLDTGELWSERASAGENERLEATSHSSVAVGERMNHHQVEMSHGGPDHWRRVGRIRTVQDAHQLVDQRGDKVGTWAFIDRHPLLVVANKDRSCAPTPRILAQVVLDHHVVKAAKEGRRVRDVRVVCQW